MAIKVNGTTVIDDSRNLVNIASGAGASTTAGDVGTYAFASCDTRTTFGTTVAGSALKASSITIFSSFADNQDNAAKITRTSSTLSGTWRCMGTNTITGSYYYTTDTIWVRIS